MVSEVNNNFSGMGAAKSSTVAAPPTHRPISIPEAPSSPKVIAPKPVAIQYDSGKLKQDMQEAVRLLNTQMEVTKRGLGFSFDESLGAPVVTVRSVSTGEVIRQIPNEAAVRMAHSIDHLKGFLINAKV